MDRALEIPPELEPVVFFILETMEFLDQVNFEFSADPHTEFRGNVFVRVGTTVPSGGSPQATQVGFCDLVLDADLVAVQAGMTFNCGEFAITKIGVMDAFPDP